MWKSSETVGFGKASKGTNTAVVALYNPAGNRIGFFDENVEVSPENTSTASVTTEDTQTPSLTPEESVTSEGVSTPSVTQTDATTPSTTTEGSLNPSMTSEGTPAPDVLESIKEKLELLIKIFRERINKM